MKAWICFVFLLHGMMLYAQNTYYLDNLDGNDDNAGTSPAKAWRSPDKINHIILKPGDKVLFKANQTFEGNISLDGMDSGTPQKPVTISSYGKGRAIIQARNRDGIMAENISFMQVSNLYFIGDGVEKNAGSGINFFSNRTDRACSNIRVTNCVVQGFHNYGILFSCAEGETIKGFSEVRITNCSALLNGEAGIGSYGGQTSFHHKNFYIGACKAFLNKGILEKTENHSGNGIVMSDIENLLIEHCEAYENGENNRCTGGGPVGIWMWLCKNSVIQYCESHHNHAGLTKDGGGFDIDGGSSFCKLQYNYSHDNEGAGFLLAEFGAALPFINNTIRFNISENDGRKNSYGSISIWGVDSLHRVNNCYVYNNTVYLTDSDLVNGTPAAVTLFENNFKHVLVANNIFYVLNGARILNAETAFDTSHVYFLGNDFASLSSGHLFFYNDSLLHNDADWKNLDPSQQTYKGSKKNNYIIPLFRTNLKGSAKFHLQNATAFQNKGIDLKKLFGIDAGNKDFFQQSIKPASYFLGAAIR